jgi:hypothetical protein
VLGVRRRRELATDRKKMAGYSSTGQSPQRAVVLMEEDVTCIIFFLWPNSPNRARAASFVRFLNHTVGRTVEPLI